MTSSIVTPKLLQFHSSTAWRFRLYHRRGIKSKKPVITCIDSGEPSRIVQNGVNGYVVDQTQRWLARRWIIWLDTLMKPGWWENEDLSRFRILPGRGLLRNCYTLLPLHKTTRRKRRILVTDNQVLDPPVGGGRVRIFELYRHFDPSVNDITYLGTFDWLGPQEREQKLADHFTRSWYQWPSNRSAWMEFLAGWPKQPHWMWQHLFC